MALLVERIDITTTGLDLKLRAEGLPGLAREILAKPKMDNAA